MSISHNPIEASTTVGPRSYKTIMRQLLNTALDLVFPPSCANCSKVDAYWCQRCLDLLQTLPVEILPTTLPDTALPGTVSTGWHNGKLQNAIHGLKYENALETAPVLGQRIATALVRLKWKIDMLVPVPLHTKRLAQRGYNQAQVISEEAAPLVSLPCVPQALTRARNTPSQVGLGAQQRRDNMTDAFHADPLLLENKTVLLIDDVCTTGSTLSACAQAAQAAGAKAIYALTVTKAHR